MYIDHHCDRIALEVEQDQGNQRYGVTGPIHPIVYWHCQFGICMLELDKARRGMSTTVPKLAILTSADHPQERRRRLRCSQDIVETSEHYEMQDLTNAIRHAFAQPDSEFFDDGGASLRTLQDTSQGVTDEGVPIATSV